MSGEGDRDGRLDIGEGAELRRVDDIPSTAAVADGDDPGQVELALDVARPRQPKRLPLVEAREQAEVQLGESGLQSEGLGFAAPIQPLLGVDIGNHHRKAFSANARAR